MTASPAAVPTTGDPSSRVTPDRVAVVATWVVFLAWTLFFAWVHRHNLAGSWHYFLRGAGLLETDDAPGGLHLYATHPELQIGPLAFVATLPWTLVPTGIGRLIAVVLMTGLGLVSLALVVRLIPAADARRRLSRVVPAGLLLLTVWTELATKTGHFDDVLALVLALLAMHAVARRRPVLAALLLAGAADSKPWAIAFVALLVVLPRSDWLRAGAIWAGAVAVAWLPFVLADPHTLHAVSSFVLPNSPSSALRAIGVLSAHTPRWDRPVQMVVGAGLAALAVRRGAWPAVIVVALAVRVLLDPSVFTYYTAGLLLGAVVFDLVATSWRLPWATIAGFLLVYLPRYVDKPLDLGPSASGLLRAAYCIGVVAVVLFGRLGWTRPDDLQAAPSWSPSTYPEYSASRSPSRSR